MNDPIDVIIAMENYFWPLAKGMAFNMYTNKICDDVAECANNLLDYAGKQHDDYYE